MMGGRVEVPATAQGLSPRAGAARRTVRIARSKWLLATLGFVTAAVFGNPANAQWVEWAAADGGNGHRYLWVTDDITWDEAYDDAVAAGGYLATITSQDEQDFITSSVLPSPDLELNAWLGGFQDVSAHDYTEPAGGWRWVTGEAWDYTNWMQPYEPDDAGFTGHEEHLHIWGWDENPGNYGFWNDRDGTLSDGDDSRTMGYIVEVPEPLTLSLLVLGGSVLFRRRRG